MLTKIFKASWQWIAKHRVISLIVLAALVVGGYFASQALFSAKTETRYVLAQAEKGTIMSTVSGTGQVSVSNQVDIKSKASGDVLAVNVKNGQLVKKDDLLVQLNAKDAQKTVRDALANLESAKLSLEKLQQPTDSLTLLQAQNSLASAQDSERKADDNIAKAYDDAFNAISDSFLDFPTIISGLYDVQYGNAIGVSESAIGKNQDNNAALYNSLDVDDRLKIQSFQTNAINDYQTARAKYDSNFADYRDITRTSDSAKIEALLNKTLDTARAMAQATKSESNYLDTWVDLRTNKNQTVFNQVKTYQNNISNYVSQTNSHMSTLLNLVTTLANNRQSKLDAENTIAEKTVALQKLQDGTDALDLKSQQLSVQQRVNALADAQEAYANYSVRAPFDGQVASVSVKLGDSVSSGAAITTIITQQKIANISFNEVDVAKLKVGQKATLTFDAVSDLTISGEVIDVDTLGTASQGVVSYNVKIGFDTQDDRIKPSMSVSATIVTDIKQDIVIVPNAAVKSQGTENYVQVITGSTDTSANGVVSASEPESKTVVIGVSDDTNTEISSGLSEGEYVVIKTTKTAAKTTTAPSLLQSLTPQRGNTTKSTTGTTKSTTGSGGTSAGGEMGPPGI